MVSWSLFIKISKFLKTTRQAICRFEELNKIIIRHVSEFMIILSKSFIRIKSHIQQLAEQTGMASYKLEAKQLSTHFCSELLHPQPSHTMQWQQMLLNLQQVQLVWDLEVREDTMTQQYLQYLHSLNAGVSNRQISRTIHFSTFDAKQSENCLCKKLCFILVSCTIHNIERLRIFLWRGPYQTQLWKWINQSYQLTQSIK